MPRLDPKWSTVFYSDSRGRRPVEEFLDNLPIKEQVKAARHIDLLEEFGITIKEPHVKHLEDKLWELRPMPNRVIYFLHSGKGSYSFMDLGNVRARPPEKR